MFRLSEAEFWESGLDQFNALVAGHNRYEGGEQKQQQSGIPDWAKGGKRG